MSNIKVGSYVRCIRGYHHCPTGKVGRIKSFGIEAWDDQELRCRTTIAYLEDGSGGHFASRFEHLGDGLTRRRHKRIYIGDTVLIKGTSLVGEVTQRYAGGWWVSVDGPAVTYATRDLIVIKPVVRR